MDGPCIIRQAGIDDIEGVALLFDRYRQFYGESADPDGCRGYVHDRITARESVIFVAHGDDGRLLGFVQMYESFCSVAMRPLLYLYDLYVNERSRRLGVGRQLMDAARRFAESRGAVRITLETQHSNRAGQRLYEALGYEHDVEFRSYHLTLGPASPESRG